ncbi:MAG: hypothetical protein ACTSPI_14475 [Candidatus Heimdallarchaeaceae archaeon]
MYMQPAFWKDTLGRVHLRGVFKSGPIGSSFFTLPTGYRPILNPSDGKDYSGK